MRCDSKLLSMLMCIVISAITMNAQNTTGDLDKTREYDEYLSLIKPDKIITDGINEGVLILYGQWIEPPYRIEVKNEKLLINNVQVVPPVTPPWIEKKSPVVTKQIQDISDLTLKIREEYGLLKTRYSVPEVKAKTLTNIEKYDNLVKSAYWISDYKLYIVATDGMEFSMSFIKREAPPENYMQLVLLKEKERYELQLQNGDLLVIGYGATLNVPDLYLPEYMNEIKKAAEVNDKETLNKKLQHEGLANELLFITKNSK